MKETTIVAIVCGILLIAGGVLVYYSTFNASFNFYKSELVIDGNNVSETLFFKPNKDYHTLFRNFVSPIVTGGTATGDSIEVINVKCAQGTPYARSYYDCRYFDGSSKSACLDYTENNEYGCSFGSDIGFYKGNDYQIKAEYLLSESNIFVVNGKNYIKFVAYSPNNHVYLKTGENLIINGDAVSAKSYLPKANVVIYIPYTGSITEKNIVQLTEFEFDRSPYALWILMAILPSLLFFGVWYFFGKEKSYQDMPESLSYYPMERKAWEVSSFFAPPFNVVDDQFFASMLLSLYHKKIIDVKIQEGFLSKKTLIKINKYSKSSLDEIENKFLDILVYIRDNADKEDFESGYLDFAKAASSFGMRWQVRSMFMKLSKAIKKAGEEYVETYGNGIMILSFVALFFLYVFLLQNALSIVFFMGFIVLLIIANYGLAKGTLFTKHKGEYYKEYRHWQAFKNYLEAAPSIKEGGHKATILWGKWMVYALALGLSEKALKELESKGIISEKEYHASIGFISFSHSFSASAGVSPSGGAGGFGGAGGGGVGGGGGGGR